jgi:hypothetical protein
MMRRQLLEGLCDPLHRLCGSIGIQALARSARWVFRGMGKSNVIEKRWMRDAEWSQRTGRGAHAHRPVPITLSLHRLFLGGLLPSRARLRFAGCWTIQDRMILAQSPCSNIRSLASPEDERNLNLDARNPFPTGGRPHERFWLGGASHVRGGGQRRDGRAGKPKTCWTKAPA